MINHDQLERDRAHLSELIQHPGFTVLAKEWDQIRAGIAEKAMAPATTIEEVVTLRSQHAFAGTYTPASIAKSAMASIKAKLKQRQDDEDPEQ